MKKTRKKLIISIILVIVAAIGLFIYEETMFSLDAFKFDLQNNILRPSQVYVPEDTSSKLSVSEAEEKLLAYGMDERIVQDMDKVKKREYVCADQIEIRVSYFRINRSGCVDWITQEEAKAGRDANKWMYFKKSDFVFTWADGSVVDKHEMVTEVKMLSRPRWRFKYELAAGVLTNSSVALDTIACKRYEYSAKEDEISVRDLSNKLTPIRSDKYFGVRLVDKLGDADADELLWCVSYRFGCLGEVREFASQLSMKQVIFR